MKKKAVALCLSISLITGLTACAGSAEETPQPEASEETAAEASEAGAETETGEAAIDFEGEPYHATVMYIVAQDSPDVAQVQERLNELTMEELNIEVELMPVTISAWMNQIQLMLVGDEPLDIAPIQSGNAATYIESGFLTDISELIQEYGQDIIAQYGMADIECCSVGDFLWGFPISKERVHPLGIVMRTDILEELNIDVSQVDSLDDFTAIYEQVQAAYPDMTMFGGPAGYTPAGLTYAYDWLADHFGVLEDYGRTTTVTNYYESDLYRNYVEILRDWYVKGYVSKDMATTADTGESLMKAGNLFSFCVPAKPNTKAEKDELTGYDTTVCLFEESAMSTTNTTGLTYVIPSNSEDPARAMQLYNWIVKTKEANDLLNWGVEGVHWVENEDGVAAYPEGVDAAGCGYHQNYGWAQLNQFNSHVWEGEDPEIFDKYEEWKNDAIVSYAYGFAVDTREVSDEMAALNSVKAEYDNLITCGAVDPDTAIQEYNDALYAAGLQEVIDLKQEQLDAWLASRTE